MHLANDWHKLEKKVSAACVLVTGGINGAWQTIQPFQQFLSQHLLTSLSTGLLVIAFIAHFVKTENPHVDNPSQSTGS